MTAPLKLTHLRYLVAVVKAGTVRQASRELNLSQSSLTKSIQQLEECVGAELLQRTRTGVSATLAGRALISRAMSIESELREARNDIDSILGMGSGEIRIAASPTVATSFLPRAVLSFKKSRPKVTVELNEGIYPDVLQAVRKGDIDFAVCLVPDWIDDETISSEILLRDRVVPAVRKGHPLEGRRLTAAELQRADWATYRRGRSGRDIFEQTFVAAGMDPPRSTIECSSFACLFALVEQGDYLTLLPKKLLIETAVSRSLSSLALQFEMPEWNAAVLYRTQHDLSPVCKAFLDELRGVARRIIASGQPAAAVPSPRG